MGACLNNSSSCCETCGSVTSKIYFSEMKRIVEGMEKRRVSRGGLDQILVRRTKLEIGLEHISFAWGAISAHMPRAPRGEPQVVDAGAHRRFGAAWPKNPHRISPTRSFGDSDARIVRAPRAWLSAEGVIPVG